ncbi:hypothetical protein [Fibrella arboris]|uniref:hypothetical protein n=1 Tax=Fibrella arboris TaxID=3242486 RepID=UPI0035203F94
MDKKSIRVNHYDIFEVIDRFAIEKIRHCSILDEWMSATDKLSSFEAELCEKARTELELKWDEWNEEELKMNFIGLILFAAYLDVPKKIRTFYERKLTGKVNDILISVTIDCMIASPMNSGRPKSPYFFLQEFKRSLGDNHDPEGQMLAAMILAQELNQDNKPLYGCWIQGKNWYFTVLNGKDYCVSTQFDATKSDDLLQIVYILRKLKELILAR